MSKMIGGWPHRHPPNTAISLNQSSLQANGLVGWWTTSIPGTNRLWDLSGYANHIDWTGTSTDPTWQRTGIRGNSLYWEDTDDLLDIPYNSRLTPGSGNITWSFWIAPLNDGSNVQEFMCDRALGAGGTAEGIIIGQAGIVVASRPTVLIEASDNSFKNYQYNDAYVIDKWQHMCMTWNNAADELKFYIDGKFITPTTIHQDDVLTGKSIDVGTDIRIGNHAGTTDRAIDGYMDDVRIYNRVLTADEVATMFAPETRYELYQPATPFIVGLSIPLEDVRATKVGAYIELTGDETVYTTKAGALIEFHTPWTAVPDDPTNLVAVVV